MMITAPLYRPRVPARLLAAAVLLFGVAPVPAIGADAKDPGEAESVGQALTRGKLSLGLRYRFELVSDDTPAISLEDGKASTLRTTLAYTSARYRGFGIHLEFEDVTDVGLGDEHNNLGAGSLANGVTNRPAIADPDLTEVNQAYLVYRGFRNTTIHAGRQEIALSEQRFVGPVGWRQNHQSFDALRVVQTSIPRTKLNYAYLADVHRIFGDHKQLHGHLLNAEVSVGEKGRLTPYVYSLDYDAMADACLSTLTYGARWQNSFDCRGGWTFPYHVELARQSDAGDNPANVDAGYFRVELAGKHRWLTLRAGWEMLEGSPADGTFSTPLATLHKWNGWADKFLVTPPDGLEDLYVSFGGGGEHVKASLVYHDFGSDTGGLDYGSEIDAVVSYDAPWKQTFGLKLALYDADTFSADTEKIMAFTSYSF